MSLFNAQEGAGKDTGSGLIPKNQLALCTIVKAEPRIGNDSGLRYVALELVINPGQPYERCHIWHNLMDPTDSNHKENTRTIATASIARILEVGRKANPQSNPTGYQINDWSDLIGLACAIKIGVEKGTGTYEDKNKVQEFLTPNPESSASKAFQMLMKGQFNTSPGASTAPTQASMSFGGAPAAPAPAPQSGGGWPTQGGSANEEIPFNGGGGQEPEQGPGPQSGSWL